MCDVDVDFGYKLRNYFFMLTNSEDSDDGSSIGGIIESETVTSGTWDLEAE